ncbi:hypothetical protein DENSPDRAFT_839568 [Dentipellis sp. KUC8613]|nr:hypothetical protein DENSPDRAFT_839568 [Dentipellis sp. KUC8613]
MARGRAERQEERRAWRDERRGFKEERRDAILGLVGLGGKKEEPKEGEEEVPVMKTGVGVRDVHPNLFLEGHNFGVSGEVWVLDSGERKERGRAVLKLVNYHAKVDLVVVRVSLSLNAGRARPHLSITMHSQNGSVNMALPREFRGQLRLSSDHGRIRLSPAVEAITEKQSKTYRTLTCFVGQMPENWHTLSVQVGTAGEGSVGVDEAVAVTRNGSVTVRFEDEPPLEGLISEVAGALKRVVTGKNGKPADADMEENQLVTQSEVAGLERGEKEMEVESMV